MSENSTQTTSSQTNSDKNLLIVAILYFFAIFNEFIALYSPFNSAIASALVIFLALNIAAWNYKTPLYRVLPALALVPFMRMLSLVLPLTGSNNKLWYLLVALPVLTSLALLLRSRHISLASIGLRRSAWMTQLPIALTGLPLGFIGFLILRPSQLFPANGLWLWAANLLILLIFVSFTEEVLFRGLLLRVMSEINAPVASISLAVLYASLHIGSKSPVYALYMGLVGWLFSRFASQTGSIWGIVVANFLLVAGMGLVWPLLLF